MAATMFALLSQPTPNLATRKGLVITGLQNDLLPGGKLPLDIPPGYFDQLQQFVSLFREFGDVIWVRSESESNSATNRDGDDRETVLLGNVWNETGEQDHEGDSSVPVKKPRASFEGTNETVTASGEQPIKQLPQDSVDDELFLKQTPTKDACCLSGSWGAEFPVEVQRIIDPSKDLVITSTHYSAFASTSLLMTLRMKLITELFICGGPTNISVYATAMDAGRHALPITLVDDFLVARSAHRHRMAIKHLREALEADIKTGDKVIDSLRNPPAAADDDEYENVYEVEYEGSAQGVTDDLMFEEQVLEVDDEREDEDMPDLPPTRRASSYFYDRLQSLRFSSPQMLNMRSSGSGEASQFSVSAPSGSSNPLGAAVSSQLTKRAILTKGAACSGAHSVDGIRENSDEGGLREESLTNMDEPSRQEKIEYWLRLDDTAKTLRNAAPSIHPALDAVASMSRPDEQLMRSSDARVSDVANSARLIEQPLFGVDKELESGGSSIMYDLLPSSLAETILDKLKDEISWQRMHHQTGEVPRLVCCQGTIDDDGNMPVYRHPSDQTIQAQPWTPTVNQVRKAAEEAVGHGLNHALIQWYRGGTDYISEHSDKTLDIVKDSYIVNVSFGAQRTMRLRTKRAAVVPPETASPARRTYRIPMPHNSMIKMSLATNAEYLHGINADKRPPVELTESEKAYEGHRISLTFRNIGTFLNHDSSRIWGIGATGKSREDASAVINADAEESEKLVRAFGAENQASSVRWDEIYGDGFDVLHLR